MSYEEEVCPKCGGEVRVFVESGALCGGTCPHCGTWVSAGVREEEEVKQRIRGWYVDWFEQVDDDRTYSGCKFFKTEEEARNYAKELGYVEQLSVYPVMEEVE